MIVDQKVGLRIITREILMVILLMAAWDLVVVILFQIFHQEWMEQPSLPVSLIGSALALFMAFAPTVRMRGGGRGAHYGAPLPITAAPLAGRPAHCWATGMT